MERTKRILILILITAASFVHLSCTKINESPEGCVVSFIVASEQRNMTRAWDVLGPEAQKYYNSLGEKMRKSGKGALENQIASVTKFRSVKKDYTIEPDAVNKNLVRIVTVGGPVHEIETENTDGNYKIKNYQSVKNLLEGISAEIKKEEGY